jgi:hypothetical protein
MQLTDFVVPQPDNQADQVLIYAQEGWHVVVAVIPRVHLEHHFGHGRLTASEAALIVRANLNSLAPVVVEKYERGEYQSNTDAATKMRCVYFKPSDISAAGSKLTDSVLRDSGSNGHENRSG